MAENKRFPIPRPMILLILYFYFLLYYFTFGNFSLIYKSTPFMMRSVFMTFVKWASYFEPDRMRYLCLNTFINIVVRFDRYFPPLCWTTHGPRGGRGGACDVNKHRHVLTAQLSWSWRTALISQQRAKDTHREVGYRLHAEVMKPVCQR